MLRQVCILFEKKHAPSLGSSLLNPRSNRAKLRKMMATHQAQSEHFEGQALHAEIGGERSTTIKRKSRTQRRRHYTKQVGQRVAEEARHMTDAEWESVSMDDKHAFTQYLSRLLQESPGEVSEQQRRRYFETTMVDPREMDPNRTVKDAYERLKLGLPLQLKDPQRSSGVSQALYESGEASLFDPDKVNELENAMIHVKQVYADYVEKRREGVSTEQERRQLAHLTAALNVETQKHLANLFKYAEERVRSLAMAERKEQLEELQRLKEAIQQRPNQNSNNTNKKSSKRRSKKQRIKQSISAAIGLDVGVVDSMLSEMEAQEKFMQFCEVFARLTVGRGFTHTAEDEGLDAYTESMKKLYSVDAGTMSTLEAVQYMAAKESVPPVEWARRWYERAVLLPLQQTPEYKRLEEIRTQELEALKLRREIQQKEEEGTPSEERALVAGSEAARLTEEKPSSSSKNVHEEG
ncbi:hypothetical protein AGDE_06777 [Angomonas deanei]|nr:hypothetical protein AGDE_06777 [Angomonas deanei]|eukprot:EPY36718.1 hypothetical protein AGDE_06777 [Angomonas deanei]